MKMGEDMDNHEDRIDDPPPVPKIIRKPSNHWRIYRIF